MPEQAKITTLYDNTTNEAIAPRTVMSAISGEGSEGQLIGFTGENTLGRITPDTKLRAGSKKPVASGVVYEEINKLATKDELANCIPASKEADFATRTDLQGYLPASKEADFATKTEVTTLLEDKQDKLIFDNAPASGSNNPVKSSGIYNAITQAQYKPKVLTLNLITSSWSSADSPTQTVTATGVLASETAQLIIPTPAMSSLTAYYESGVKLTAQTTDRLTFTADSKPENNLTVYVAILPMEGT